MKQCRQHLHGSPARNPTVPTPYHHGQWKDENDSIPGYYASRNGPFGKRPSLCCACWGKRSLQRSFFPGKAVARTRYLRLNIRFLQQKESQRFVCYPSRLVNLPSSSSNPETALAIASILCLLSSRATFSFYSASVCLI